jgi:cell division protein ZapA (FtsZ GTPase activity inhibitor)
MNSLKIKINIAGRQYPLTINAEEEEAVRNAGKEINKLIQEFEDRYAVTDKQDAISMVALQMASKLNIMKLQGEGSSSIANEKIVQLTEFIERELENK